MLAASVVVLAVSDFTMLFGASDGLRVGCGVGGLVGRTVMSPPPPPPSLGNVGRNVGWPEGALVGTRVGSSVASDRVGIHDGDGEVGCSVGGCVH